MKQIFLSHNSKDKPFVRKLASDLRHYGHTVWIDEAEINIGDSLIGKIREGLDKVDYVAVILSKASIESEWVKKEIEIASTREIYEKRVIVLPIIIESVELPAFLIGKFYGDFSNESDYIENFNLLLRSIGTSEKVTPNEGAELGRLKAELKEALLVAEKYRKETDKLREFSLSTKSNKLRAEIEKDNKRNPDHAPINSVYAFELDKVPITLGYLLWVIGKIQLQGYHAVAILLEMHGSWDLAKRMIEAYSEMLESSPE